MTPKALLNTIGYGCFLSSYACFFFCPLSILLLLSRVSLISQNLAKTFCFCSLSQFLVLKYVVNGNCVLFTAAASALFFYYFN